MDIVDDKTFVHVLAKNLSKCSSNMHDVKPHDINTINKYKLIKTFLIVNDIRSSAKFLKHFDFFKKISSTLLNEEDYIDIEQCAQ